MFIMRVVSMPIIDVLIVDVSSQWHVSSIADANVSSSLIGTRTSTMSVCQLNHFCLYYEVRLVHAVSLLWRTELASRT